MHYDIRKILCGTALAIVMGFAVNNDAYAQGTDDSLPIIGVDTEFLSPELALFDEVNDSDGLIGLEPTNLGALSTAPEENTVNLSAEQDIEFAEPLLVEDADINVDMNNPLLKARMENQQNAAVADNTNVSLLGLVGENEVSLGGPPAGGGASIGTQATSGSTGSASLAAPKIEQDDLADKLIAKSNDSLFSQMSDLERQTTLLTLELRREKIKSEIEAIRAQRRRAEEEEKAYREEKERKKIEWENEQKRLILIEEQKIIELEIAMEKERQERIVKAYKESMLKDNQKWIDNNEKVYKILDEVEKDRDGLYENVKGKMSTLVDYSGELLNTAKTAKENHDKKVEELQLQNAILKARLAAAEAEKRAAKTNPFAEDDNFMENPDANQPKLSDEYAVIEIRGQGDDLIAKLMNKDKKTFIIKEGTILHTGHRIDEITRNYVRGELNGYKDFIYLSVGMAIEREPTTKVEDQVKAAVKAGKQAQAAAAATPASSTARAPSLRRRNITTNKGIPSVSSGLMIK